MKPVLSIEMRTCQETQGIRELGGERGFTPSAKKPWQALVLLWTEADQEQIALDDA